MYALIVTALLAAPALASPAPLAATVNCKAVTTSCPPNSYTAYCSSYLNIPKSTVTVNKKTTTTSATTVTVFTSTATETLCGTTVSTITTTDTAYETITVATCATDPYKKRAVNAQTVAKPACLKQYTAASQISSACSCAPISTGTTTITSITGTVTKKKTVTQSTDTTTTTDCAEGTVTSSVTVGTVSTSTVTSSTAGPNPTGVQYAQYHNDQGLAITGPAADIDWPGHACKPHGSDSTNFYANYDPTYVKAQPYGEGPTPLDTGVTQNNQPLLNSGPQDNTETFEYRGYVYAVNGGNWTFSISNIDDIAFIWIGTAAQSGWDRNNVALFGVYTASSGPGHYAYTYPLSVGQYLPFRFMWANGGGPGSVEFTITAPDGTQVFGDYSDGSSGLVIQYSCDGVSAPPYAGTFGNEPN